MNLYVKEIMEESLSSSSFFDENENSPTQYRFPQLDIQELQLENQRLTHINDELNKSLSSTKKQLEDALKASASISIMTEQIKNLQSQLEEAKSENKKLSSSQLGNSRDQMEKSLRQSDLQRQKDENDDLKLKLVTLKNKVSDLKKENRTLASSKDQLQSNLQDTIKKMAKIDKTKNQFKDNFTKATQELKEREKQIGIIEKEKVSIQQEIAELTKANQELKIKLETNLEASQLNNSSQKQNLDVYNVFDHQLSLQQVEIESISKDRQTLSSMIYKLQAGLATSESIINEIQKEKIILEGKLDFMNQSPIESLNLYDLDIPIEGDIEVKWNQIINVKQYSTQQKIQLIINEFTKAFNSMNDEITQLKKESKTYQSNILIERQTGEKYRELLRSVIAELKDRLMTENFLMQEVGDKDDGDFIHYLSRKCIDISQISDFDSKQSPLLPTGYFSGTLPQQCKEIITKFIQPNEVSMNLFVAQFLINHFLQKQVKRLKVAAKNRENADSIIRAVGCNNINEIPATFDGLNRKIDKVKHSRRQIYQNLKKAQQYLLEKNQKESDQISTIEQLKLQNDTLKNQVNVLEVKCMVANNELLMSNSKIEEDANQAEQADANSQIMIERYEDELAAKDEEISRLLKQINQLKEAENISSLKLKKSQEFLEEKLSAQEQKVMSIQTKYNEKKKQYKKKLIMIMQKCDKDLKDKTERLEESKQSLNQMMTSLKEKNNELYESNRKVLVNLKELERQNQSISMENRQLQVAQKANEIEIKNMQDKLLKEKQNLQVKVSAQQMACETKIQDIVSNLKQEMQKQKQEIYNTAIKMFNDLFAINPYGFNEESYSRLLYQIKNEIIKHRK